MTLVSTQELDNGLSSNIKLIDASWHFLSNRDGFKEYQKEHIEVVKVEFDPKIISYEEVARLFFKFHDPTTINRQGPNVGYQYRSEIFYNTDSEKEIAEKVLNEINEKLDGKVVTKISKEENYCKAEEYHQKYFQKKTKK